MSPGQERPPADEKEPVEIKKLRYRTIGAVHLGLTAAANLATGLGLVYLGATGRLVRWALTELDTYVSEPTLVREAVLVASAATTGAVLVGLALLTLGGAAAIVAVGAARGRRTRWWVPVSVASVLNPLTVPLAFAAAVLLWLGRPGRELP